MNKETTLVRYQKRITKVLQFIEQNLDDELSLEQLAVISCFSLYHFHRVFSGMVGESVKSYVRRLKLQRAAYQLRYTNMSVTNIGLEAGYNSLEAFIKGFKEWFELSPRSYRQEVAVELANRLETIFNHHTEGVKLMNVEIKEIKPMRVATVRHVGPYIECAKAWETLCACPGLPIGPTTKFLGICYDDPEVTEADKIRYDACITVPESFESAGEVQSQAVNGGKYAVTTHVGPYTQLSKVYNELCGQWLPQNGYELRAEPSFEIYVSDSKTTPEDKLITEIYVPVV